MKLVDKTSGFKCGVHALDDYFRRWAYENDQAGVGCAYVLESSPDEQDSGLPLVLGYYTLSMASVESSAVSPLLGAALPRYPIPVALIGRQRAELAARSPQGRLDELFHLLSFDVRILLGTSKLPLGWPLYEEYERLARVLTRLNLDDGAL